MRKRPMRRLIMLSLTLFLILTSSLPIEAVEGKGTEAETTTPTVQPLSPPLTIQGKSTVTLTNIFAVPGQEGQSLAFSLEVSNQDTRVIDFDEYWIRLGSNSGAAYRIGMYELGKRSKILPGQKEVYTFYSMIPHGIKIEDLEIKLIKWNMNANNFEDEIGTFKVNREALAAQGKSATKKIGATQGMIEGTMSKGIAASNNDEVTVSYKLTLLNTGFLPFTVPSYQMALVSQEGFVYPLFVTSESDETPLAPKMKREIVITGNVPSSIDTDRASIYVLMPIGGENNLIPVANFQDFSVATVPIGDVLKFGESREILLAGDGKGRVTLTKAQRLPWDYDDLLSAQIKIENIGDKSFELPILEGKYTLDQSSELSAEVILDSKKKSLNPNEHVYYYVTGYFPYTTIFSGIDIQLSEKKGEGNSVLISGLPTFKFTSSSLSVPNVALNTPIEIGNVGERKSINVLESHIYQAWNEDLIVTRLEIKNLERRSVQNSHLTGFYQDGAGNIYPAEEIALDTNILPSGSALSTIWARVPKGINKDDLLLTVGQAIGDQSGEGTGFLAEGMKDGVNFSLPTKEQKPVTRLTNLSIYPYDISFNNISTTVRINGDNKSYRVSFRYGIEKVSSVATDKNAKLSVEITDPYGNILGDKAETIHLEGENAWRPGLKSITLESIESLNRTIYFNLYENFEDGRRLIGVQPISVWQEYDEEEPPGDPNGENGDGNDDSGDEGN